MITSGIGAMVMKLAGWTGRHTPCLMLAFARSMRTTDHLQALHLCAVHEGPPASHTAHLPVSVLRMLVVAPPTGLLCTPLDVMSLGFEFCPLRRLARWLRLSLQGPQESMKLFHLRSWCAIETALPVALSVLAESPVLPGHAAGVAPPGHESGASAHANALQ